MKKVIGWAILVNILLVGLDFLVGSNWPGSPLDSLTSTLASPFLKVDICVLSGIVAVLGIGLLFWPLVLLFLFIVFSVEVGVRCGKSK